MATDTIYALASGAGRAGVAVIRVSGPASDRVLARLTGQTLPAPRVASLRRLRDAGGEPLDTALVLRFSEGASFTGEAVIEIHGHGGPAVVRAAMSAVAAAGPARLAEPGEFTLRAFQNGRMDLAEVEALADLLAAETEGQRRQASRLMDGALHRAAEDWRRDLLEALALLEVTIDWADEEVPEDVTPEVNARLGRVAEGIGGHLAVADGAARLRAGLEVAILGAPNSGKSSLLNALAGREAALTSPVPGTTRDVVELRYELGGLAVTFLDMAGLRESTDPLEAAGVARARERAVGADMRVLLQAPDAPLGPEALALAKPGDLRVRSKADVGSCEGEGLAVSAETGQGLREFLERIAQALSGRVSSEGLVAHRRQREALEAGGEALTAAREGLDRKGVEEVSEDVRGAIRALERVTGQVGAEDVLGEIFGRFCLGK